MGVFHSQAIKDEPQVGAARRAVRRFAQQAGFGADALSDLEIVVQEIGTNAVRYATQGGCLHWRSSLCGGQGIELTYEDKGPGIHDLDRALRDGVSSGGSLGTGFGAMRRLLDEFDAHSTVKGTTRRLTSARRTTWGTALLGRKWARPPRDAAEERERAQARRRGVWTRPRPGEDRNGDAYFFGEHSGKVLLTVVDGLGHGHGAAEAAGAAVEVLEAWEGEPLDDLFWGLHDALRATRGAVVGAVLIDEPRGSFAYAGVGNVEVRVIGTDEPVRPVPANGTLGARLSQLRVWPHRYEPGTTFVLATDGLSAKWDLSSYPGLRHRSPQLMAGVLARDYSRNSDDATIIIYR
ncbi:MAG TPA: ATP-binding protein [Pyrinomonadaceae bacterium]|nr:ATP-binding protein [Pyrinomonadaceae bacterium]